MRRLSDSLLDTMEWKRDNNQNTCCWSLQRNPAILILGLLATNLVSNLYVFNCFSTLSWGQNSFARVNIETNYVGIWMILDDLKSPFCLYIPNDAFLSWDANQGLFIKESTLNDFICMSFKYHYLWLDYIFTNFIDNNFTVFSSTCKKWGIIWECNAINRLTMIIMFDNMSQCVTFIKFYLSVIAPDCNHNFIWT